MTQFQAAILGIVQGITEMLPVSSSMHLLFVSKFLNLPDQRLSFDLFLNIGTVLAIIMFFWKQVLSLIKGGFDFLLNKKSQNRNLFITLIVANIPVIFAGCILETLHRTLGKSLEAFLHSPVSIAISLIIFSVVLGWCDANGDNEKQSERIDIVSRKDAFITGCAQICALFPGVSRLGICYSILRYLRYSRLESFKFAMFLSIIPVSGICFVKTLGMFNGNIMMENWTLIGIGCAFSFIAGSFTLPAISAFFKKHGMLVFVLYRILLGLFILMQYRTLYGVICALFCLILYASYLKFFRSN